MTAAESPELDPLWLVSHSMPFPVGDALRFGVVNGLVCGQDLPAVLEDPPSTAWCLQVDDVLEQRGVGGAYRAHAAQHAFVPTCPPWCSQEHEVVVADPVLDGVSHVALAARAGALVEIRLVRYEFRSGAEPLTLEVGSDFPEQFDGPQARQLAAAMLEAADLWDRNLAQTS